MGSFLTADMFPPRAADGVNRAPSVSHTPVTTCLVLSGVSHLHTSSGCRKFVTSGSEQIVTSYLSLLELHFSPSLPPFSSRDESGRRSDPRTPAGMRVGGGEEERIITALPLG